MKLLKFFFAGNIVLRILIGIALAFVLYFVLPNDLLSKFGILGEMFVGLLRAIAPLLVFVLVISSIARAKIEANNVIRNIIFTYLLSMTLAAITAVIITTLFPVKVTFTNVEAASLSNVPAGTLDVLKIQFLKIFQNPISALTESNFLSLLTWAVLFGIALRSTGEKTREVVGGIGDALVKVVKWIVELAPFGVFGITAATLADDKITEFLNYGQLILVLLAGFAIVAFIQLPLIGFIIRKKNSFPLLFTVLSRSGITAFFSRSSVANIPVNMNTAEKLGIDKSIYSFSIPFGANINLTASAVTISTLALVAAYSYGAEVTIVTTIIVAIIATIASVGASGVPGGSLIMIPIATSLFNIPADVAAQMVGIGFLITVVQDSVETAINSSSDLFFTYSVAEREGLVDKENCEIKNI